MRVGLLSDVHANLQALRTVLERLEAETPDQLVCLGDVVGYGGDPEACVELVRERTGPIVMGNHDAAAVLPWVRDSFHSWARAAVEAHAAWLDPGALAFLADLPATAYIGNGGERGLHLTHGMPGESVPFTYLVSAAQAEPALASFTERFGAVGHTHVPASFEAAAGLGPRARDLRAEAPSAADPARDARIDFTIEPGRRAILNPGSVGQPRDGDPRASCMILDLETGTVRWLRLVYDVEGAQAAIRRRGLPEILAARLALGR